MKVASGAAVRMAGPRFQSCVVGAGVVMLAALSLCVHAKPVEANEALSSQGRECGRLELDLPSDVQWKVDEEGNEDEPDSARWYRPIPADGEDYFVDEIEVSTIDKSGSPYGANELPERVYRLVSVYDSGVRMTILDEGRKAEGYWAVYKISGGVVSRTTMLGVVRESRASIHMVTMELDGDVDPKQMRRWSDILAGSRVVSCEG